MTQQKNNPLTGQAIVLFITTTCCMLCYHCGYKKGFNERYHEKNAVMLDNVMRITEHSIKASERCVNVLENSCSLKSIIKK